MSPYMTLALLLMAALVAGFIGVRGGVFARWYEAGAKWIGAKLAEWWFDGRPR